MKKNLAKISFGIFVVTAFILIGLLLWLFSVTNTRVYTRDNITCEARKRENVPHPSYHWVRVGTADQPYSGVPNLRIRLPNLKIVNLNKVTLDLLMTSDGNVSQIDLGSPWPPGTRQITLGYYIFVFSGDKVSSLQVIEKGYGRYIRGIPSPAIGLLGDARLIELPLTEEQVISIFGEADKIEEVLRE